MIRIHSHPLDSVPADAIGGHGYCSDCKKEHVLNCGEAVPYAQELLQQLERAGRIDIFSRDTEPDPAFSLEYLYSPARGQMFGVLLAEDERGERHVLRAFSGQYNSRWGLEGWAPPVVDAASFQDVNIPGERDIKRLSREIEQCVSSEERCTLKRQRREQSRDLMHRLHDLYWLTNFKGQSRPMTEVFQGQGNPPTGTGECCAPKLLQQAALRGWHPLGLVEFYIGRENRSGTKKHGYWYPSCDDKCQPILGFMLCGTERKDNAE